METETTGPFKNRQLIRATGLRIELCTKKTKNNRPFGEESGVILTEL